MALFVLVLLGSVAVITYLRRLARHGALQLVKDVLSSAVLLGRWLCVVGRLYCRLVLGKVRSW